MEEMKYSNLSEDEKMFLDFIRCLSDEDKEELLNHMKRLENKNCISEH